VKEYPSISSSVGQRFRELPSAYVFDKLDGSNLRFEWNRKRGWYKYGTRSRLFDEKDPDFGEAIPLFQGTLAEPLTKICRDERHDQVVVFCEFWGRKSFAGLHEKDDLKRLTLFDIAVHKRGVLGPKEFLRLTKPLQETSCLDDNGVRVPLVPYFFGQHNWTRAFVENIRNTPEAVLDRGAISFEGVVGKTGDGRTHNLVMAKAKTQKWIDAVLAKYGPKEGQKIIES